MTALGPLRADALHRGDVFDPGRPDAPHRPELADQRLLPPLSDPGNLVERGEDDPPLPELLVVGVGEPVRLVPEALEQLEALGLTRQDDRLAEAVDVDQFLLLRQRNRGDRLVVFEQHLAGRVELAAAAVEDDEVGQRRRAPSPAGSGAPFPAASAPRRARSPRWGVASATRPPRRPASHCSITSASGTGSGRRISGGTALAVS